MRVVTDMNTLSRWIANVWQMFTKAENSSEDFNNICRTRMSNCHGKFYRNIHCKETRSYNNYLVKKKWQSVRLVLSTMHFLSRLTIMKNCRWTFLSRTLKAFIELYVLRKILVQISSVLRPLTLILVNRRLSQREYFLKNRDV